MWGPAPPPLAPTPSVDVPDSHTACHRSTLHGQFSHAGLSPFRNLAQLPPPLPPHPHPTPPLTQAHGTSATPVQQDLRWGCSVKIAEQICNHNRHYAERAGYWEKSSAFLNEEGDNSGEITFYDANTGEALFYAPRDRSFQQFVDESRSHGWPSFRDNEVNWEQVRVLDGGETVSVAGTHLGHNIPDHHGNRYCINLVCVAGRPKEQIK